MGNAPRMDAASSTPRAESGHGLFTDRRAGTPYPSNCGGSPIRPEPSGHPFARRSSRLLILGSAGHAVCPAHFYVITRALISVINVSPEYGRAATAERKAASTP